MNGDVRAPTFYENGREYQAFRKYQYMSPCDEKAEEYQDIGHNIFQKARFGRLHNAPISTRDGARILDLGTGTGFWALDMAHLYPRAEIRGLDLAAMHPQPRSTLPRNVRFSVPVDYEGIWSLGEDSWDLIHLRLGCGSVSDWPELYRNILAHLKPGTGYFEGVEIDFEPRCDDGTMTRKSPLVEWYGDLKNATAKANRPIQLRLNTKQTLEKAGFVDVTEEKIMLPINGWHPNMHLKSIGTDYTAWMCYDGVEAMSLQPFTHVERMTVERAQHSAHEAALDILRPKLHAYNNIHIWTARRPSL